MKVKKRVTYPAFFIIACVVALILLPAAVLKWLYPSPRDSVLYMVIGVFEAVLALGLLLYYKSWRIWVCLMLIVSLWMGFSLYTVLFGLPCSCMGGAFALPRGVSLGLNGIMFLGTTTVLSHYPTDPVSLRRLIWFVGFMLIIGFIVSSLYYNSYN